MARIPDELLRRIREEVPLERLAEGRGVELKRHGADLIGRCPFHDDREREPGELHLASMPDAARRNPTLGLS